jgi:hypothetical protein
MQRPYYGPNDPRPPTPGRNDHRGLDHSRPAYELVAAPVVMGLPALSALVTAGGVGISVRSDRVSTTVQHADNGVG